MNENLSRNVKLALLFLDDAKRETVNLQHEDPIMRGISGQKIIDGDIAKAKQLLIEASLAGEDTAYLLAKCHSMVADIAAEVAEYYVMRANENEVEMKHYNEWLAILIDSREKAVRLDPSQGNFLLLGIWLQSCERYQEARNALTQAEAGSDEELSLQASKLLLKLNDGTVSINNVGGIRLIGFDPTKKINVIRLIRELANIGLKEAKDFVEGSPSMIACSHIEADSIFTILKDGGAIVEFINGRILSQSYICVKLPDNKNKYY
jgi:hypothetical protein